MSGRKIYRLSLLEYKSISGHTAPESLERLRFKVFAPDTDEPAAESAWNADFAASIDVPASAPEAAEVRVLVEEVKSSSAFAAPAFVGELFITLGSESDEPSFVHLKTRRQGVSKALIKVRFACIVGRTAAAKKPALDPTMLALLEATTAAASSSSSSSLSPAAQLAGQSSGPTRAGPVARRVTIMERNVVRRVLTVQLPAEEPFQSLGLGASIKSIPFTERTTVGELVLTLLRKPDLASLHDQAASFALFRNGEQVDSALPLFPIFQPRDMFVVRLLSRAAQPLPSVEPPKPKPVAKPPIAQLKADKASHSFTGLHIRERISRRFASQADFVVSAPSGPAEHRSHIGIDTSTGGFEATRIDPSLQVALLKLAAEPTPSSSSNSQSSSSNSQSSSSNSQSSSSNSQSSSSNSQSSSSNSQSTIEPISPRASSADPVSSKSAWSRGPPPVFQERVQECAGAGCTELDLSGLDMTDALNFAQHVPAAMRSDVFALDAGFNEFCTLPAASLAQFKRLTELSLDGNRLTELPAAIAELPRLEKLSLAGNNISALSPKLLAVTGLQRLNLANNQLTALLSAVCELTRLTDLVLAGNPLRSLPLGMGGMKMLETLDCMGCQLEYLPESVCKCLRLMDLNVAGNELRSLPTDIGQLTRLCVLNIAGNSVAELPVSLACCEGLTSLSLAGNPLADPVCKEKARAGTDHLMFFLEKRLFDAQASHTPIFTRDGAPPCDPRAVASALVVAAPSAAAASPVAAADVQQAQLAALQQQQLYQQQLAQQYIIQQQQQQQLYQQQLAAQQHYLLQQQQAAAAAAAAETSSPRSDSDMEAKLDAVRQAGVAHIRDIVGQFKEYQRTLLATQADDTQQALAVAKRLGDVKDAFARIRELVPAPAAPSLAPELSHDGRSPELIKLLSTLLVCLGECSQLLVALLKQLTAATTSAELVHYVTVTKQLHASLCLAS